MSIGRDSGRERRAFLSRGRVLQAAVAFADERGLESLSMRKLGRQLGVEAMSLYKHVANKDDMLDGMVDLAFGEIHLPIGPDWRAAMRRRAISAREVCSRHPWAIGLMGSRMKPGPAKLRHHDAVIGCLRAAGFSIEMAVHAYSALDSYTYGFALQEQTLSFETPDRAGEVVEIILSRFPADEYPYLTETLVEHVGKSGYNYAHEFEFGLDLILDGLQRLRAAAGPGTIEATTRTDRCRNDS